MSIKIPKYVVQQAEEQPSYVRRHWVLFSLVGLAIVTFLIGRYSHIDVLQAFKGQKQTWDERNQLLTESNEAQKKQISRLLTDAKVKEQAIQELKNTIENLNAEKSQLKADLVFYENLLSHKDKIKTLRVFKISAKPRDVLIDLKVVLAQKLEKARIKQGEINLTLSGIQDDQGKQIDLMKQFELQDQFEFKYFQVLDYTIKLPDGFIPTRLLVKLTGKDLKTKEISEEFQWSEIVKDSTHNGATAHSAKTTAGESHVQL